MSESEYIIKYPLDLTGVAPENRVMGELHTLQPGLNRSAVPRYGAFYTDSLVVRDTDTGQELAVNDQYLPIMYYADPSERSGKEVCAGVIVTDQEVSDEISIDYQVVGGDYANITQVIIDLIENLNLDDREVMWGDLLGRPDAFPPSKHLHDLGDIYGFEFMVQALEEIRQAILYGDVVSHDEIKAMVEDRWQKAQDLVADLQAEVDAHEARTDNPHSVTKMQVGLGNVPNYPAATETEAVDGVSASRFMTPLRVKEAIAVQALEPLAAHEARVDNPHSVTKAQVGLGIVANYQPADQTEAEAGDRNDRYMTPLRVSQRVKVQVQDAFEAHEARTDNPHSVTKAQVGLGLVENFAPATTQHAIEGVANNRYMTPIRVREAVYEFAGEVLDSHIADRSNPHDVTKAQVGLGNVDNFATASNPEAVAGDSNTRFMTPLRVREAIDKFAGDALAAHVADKTNPHAVTKAQVGLSDVANYRPADQVEAELGTSNVRYMTPLTVHQAMAATVGSDLNEHKLDTTNPHEVTKAQVGLGAVQNYPVASVDEAVAGTANDRYMTPTRSRALIADMLGSELSGYVQKNAATSTSLREVNGVLQAFVSGAWRTIWPAQWA
jgi:hypothetical protein